MKKDNNIISILVIAISLATANSYLSLLNFLNWQNSERIELVSEFKTKCKCFQFQYLISNICKPLLNEYKWKFFQRLKIHLQKINTEFKGLNKIFINSIKHHHFQINQLAKSLTREALSNLSFKIFQQIKFT